MSSLLVFFRRFGTTLLTGLLLWLSWPERGFTPLIFGAFVPLLWLERQIERSKDSRKGWRFFGWSFLALGTWNGLTTWWIWNSTDVGAIVALGLNTLFMCVPWAAFHLTKRSHGPATGYLSLIFYWIGFEYLHLNWDISWPWLTLGNVFASHPEWVQWYEYTGTLGGSLWVLGVNLLIFQIIKNVFGRELLAKLRRINTLVLSANMVGLILLPLFFSVWRYQRVSDKGEPVNVVVVQPNIDPYNEKFNGTGSAQVAKLLQLASTEADSSTDLIIGPETALPDGLWEEQIGIDKDVRTIRTWLQDYPKASFLAGLSSYKQYQAGEPVSATARKFKDADAYYDAYNSAMLLDRDGNLQLYHKSRLVPGVEKMPYPKLFGFLEDYAIELGGTSGSLGMQKNRTNFETASGLKIAPAICYESIYGDFLRAYFRGGAGFLAVITNDGWWGNTPGYRQHFEYARLRAVEFRKCVARSANTGISCFINQRGDVVAQSGWWEDAVLKHTLLANDRVTFYARHGDYIGFLCAFLAVSLLAFVLFRKLISRSR